MGIGPDSDNPDGVFILIVAGIAIFLIVMGIITLLSGGINYDVFGVGQDIRQYEIRGCVEYRADPTARPARSGADDTQRPMEQRISNVQSPVSEKYH